MKKIIVSLGVLVLVIGALQIALSSSSIPRAVSFSYETPKSSILLSETFVLPPSTTTTRTVYFDAGDEVHIYMHCYSGENETIAFSVSDGSTTHLSSPKTNQINNKE